MSYPRHDLPRGYVPSSSGGMRGGMGTSAGLVVGSASGIAAPMYPRVAHPVGSNHSPSSQGPVQPQLVPSGEIPIRVVIKPGLLITPMALGPIPQVPPPRNSAKFDFDFERDFVAQMEREAAASAATSSSLPSGGESSLQQTGFSAAEGGRNSSSSGGGSAQDPMVAELQEQLELERAGFGDRGPTDLLDGDAPTQNGISPPPVQQQQQSQVLDPAAAEYMAMGYPSDVVHLALAIHNGTTQTKVIDFCNAFTQLSEMGFAPEAIAGALSLYDNDRDRALAHLAPGL